MISDLQPEAQSILKPPIYSSAEVGHVSGRAAEENAVARGNKRIEFLACSKVIRAVYGADSRAAAEAVAVPKPTYIARDSNSAPEYIVVAASDCVRKIGVSNILEGGRRIEGVTVAAGLS